MWIDIIQSIDFGYVEDVGIVPFTEDAFVSHTYRRKR